jgi:hypothetical protein
MLELVSFTVIAWAAGQFVFRMHLAGWVVKAINKRDWEQGRPADVIRWRLWWYPLAAYLLSCKPCQGFWSGLAVFFVMTPDLDPLVALSAAAAISTAIPSGVYKVKPLPSLGGGGCSGCGDSGSDRAKDIIRGRMQAREQALSAGGQKWGQNE